MTPSDDRRERCRDLHEALAAAPSLRWPSPERDRLWLVVQESICTGAHAVACPMGSTTPQLVGGEDARGDELLAAMMWLTRYEHDARALTADGLFRRLRGVAVRGRHGSARATQANTLHGITEVAGGRPVRFAAEGAA